MSTQLNRKQFSQYLRTGAVTPADETPAEATEAAEATPTAGAAYDFNTTYAKLRATQRPAPRASAQRKDGRAISSANRDTITNALAGMSEAMKTLQTHHGAIADLMRKTDPDHTRQDEYDVEGDDDSENGGHNINEGWPKSRSGAPLSEGTLLADLESVMRRLQALQQKQQLNRDMDQIQRKMALSSVRYNVKQMLQLAHAHPEEMRPGQRLRGLLSSTPNVTHTLATHKSKALSAVAMLKQLAPELVGTAAQMGMVPIAGYLSTFGNVDEGNDVCDPGCYTQTIADMKAQQARTRSRFMIPMLWMHDQTQPIGGWTSLEQDSYGLFAMGLVDPDTEKGAEAVSMLSKGYVAGLSIGYIIVKSYRGADGARHLQQIDLAEGSLVTLAMNPLASVTTLN